MPWPRGLMQACDAETCPYFTREVERLGRRALQVIGAVEIALTLLHEALYRAGLAGYPSSPVAACITPLFLLLGFATLWSATQPWGMRNSRALALLSGFLSACLLIGLGLLKSNGLAEYEDGTQIHVITVLLVGVSVVPAVPWQMAILGASVCATYFGAAAYRWGWLVPAGLTPQDVIPLVILVLLCAFLSADNYQRLQQTYRAHQEALRASEKMRAAESRAALAESNASLSRLAAALSHELNTPLGALTSSSATLARVAERYRTGAGDPTRLMAVVEELAGPIGDAARRMAEMVHRIQRFTHLDRGDIVEADVNQLIRDVAALARAEQDGQAEIDLDLQPLPIVPCRPQPLSAVLSLLAQHGLTPNGGLSKLRLSSRVASDGIVVAVDTSHPTQPADLSRLFDPGFEVAGGRVAAGNWGLFTARRIALDEGAELTAESDGHAGTRFIMTLPWPTGMAAVTAA